VAHIAHHPPFPIAAPRGVALATLLAGVWTRLRDWQQREQERAQLAALSPRELRDLGLSRTDVLAEINKPFWRE
jgi:uncharacterized protein YjiS (DUF1127 family)